MIRVIKSKVLTGCSMFLTALLIMNAGTISAEPNHQVANVKLEDLPIENFPADKINQLNNNELLMNTLGSYREISLLPETAGSKGIIEHFSDLRPNFLAEAMFVLPVEEGKEQSTLIKVKNLLQSVGQFEGIPYYSRHNGTWNPLFENMTVYRPRILSSGIEEILAEQKMRPFKPYTAVYKYDLSYGTLLYETYNLTPLYYKWMKGVEKEGMYTSLLVKAYPGYLFFYGLGGARAFDFFGLFGKRLDVAFTGRIEAFFEWFHQEFVLSELAYSPRD